MTNDATESVARAESPASQRLSAILHLLCYLPAILFLGLGGLAYLAVITAGEVGAVDSTLFMSNEAFERFATSGNWRQATPEDTQYGMLKNLPLHRLQARDGHVDVMWSLYHVRLTQLRDVTGEYAPAVGNCRTSRNILPAILIPFVGLLSMLLWVTTFRWMIRRIESPRDLPPAAAIAQR